MPRGGIGEAGDVADSVGEQGGEGRVLPVEEGVQELMNGMGGVREVGKGNGRGGAVA